MTSTTSGPLRLENQLCFSLYSVSLAMTKVYQPLLRPLGLTYPQYLVLNVLWENDNITVSSIGERLFLDSGTLTPLLKKIEIRGLIHRHRSLNDERKVLIALTASGQSLRKKVSTFPKTLLAACHCTNVEMQSLVRKIKKIRQALIDENSTNSKTKPKKKEDL